MSDSAMERALTRALNPPGLARTADAAAAAVAASLPWSTSATGILLVIWLVTLLPTLDAARLRQEVLTAAGGAPLALVALALLGTAWADVGLHERLGGLEGYLKLLCIPLLLAQFRRSPRGWWVILGFLGAATALLVASWGLALIPGLPWRGKAFGGATIGVPVKDYITQSGIFALCAFALVDQAIEAWRSGRWRLGLSLTLAAAAFFGNIVFVETGRTTIVTSAALVPLLGFRQFGWKGVAVASLVGCVFGGAIWLSSPYLRQRLSIVQEVNLYRKEHRATSSGQRLDFWRDSVAAIAKAPILGSGTGSIPERLASTVSPDTGVASFGTVNPHNEIFVAAIQLGLVGITALLGVWISHLLLFRGGDAIHWIGRVAVVQNMVGSLFNSHLSDFTQGWIYVVAIGVLGGMVLRQSGRPPLFNAAPSTVRDHPHPRLQTCPPAVAPPVGGLDTDSARLGPSGAELTMLGAVWAGSL